jgi:hypothetical protein
MWTAIVRSNGSWLAFGERGPCGRNLPMLRAIAAATTSLGPRRRDDAVFRMSSLMLTLLSPFKTPPRSPRSKSCGILSL